MVKCFIFVISIRFLFILVSEPISARRLVHVLVKLVKITKSNQHQRQPVSPSMLPEDREVTDIMTQRKVSLLRIC
jgi:hypothetical protein